MKKLVALILSTILPVFAFATTTINLSDALARKTVTMEAINTTGNYKGKAVKLTITNNSGATIELKIDLGIILKPENPAFAPLVLAGEEELTLKAHETGNVDVEVFCDNAVKAVPLNGLHYSYLRMGGDELIKVLRFVHGHSLFDHLGQSAVWSITNFHTLNNVYDPNRDSLSKKLISYIEEVTRRQKPTFYTTSTDNDVQAQPSYIARTDKIYVPFDISLQAPTVLAAAVFNAKGEKVKSIFENKQFEQGKHNVVADFAPESMEAGKYQVRILDAEKTLHEKEITIGQ